MTSKMALVYKLILNDTIFDEIPSLITMLRRNDKNFDVSILNKGFSVMARWPFDITVFVSGSQPVDYLLCGPKYRAVSNLAKEAIEAAGGGAIEFLPVNIINESSKKSFGEFWALNVLNNIDALDWERTVWISNEIPYSKPDAYLDIIKPAFKLQMIENQHIFLLRMGEHIRSGIYISAALRKELESKKATLGMDFMPIRVS